MALKPGQAAWPAWIPNFILSFFSLCPLPLLSRSRSIVCFSSASIAFMFRSPLIIKFPRNYGKTQQQSALRWLSALTDSNAIRKREDTMSFRSVGSKSVGFTNFLTLSLSLVKSGFIRGRKGRTRREEGKKKIEAEGNISGRHIVGAYRQACIVGFSPRWIHERRRGMWMVTSEKGTTVTDRSFEDANHTANVCVRRCGRNACGNRVRRRGTTKQKEIGLRPSIETAADLPSPAEKHAVQTKQIGVTGLTHMQRETPPANPPHHPRAQPTHVL